MVDDEKEILENPEWSEEDIRKGAGLEAVAPELAARIRRDLGMPIPSGRPKVRRPVRKAERSRG